MNLKAIALSLFLLFFVWPLAAEDAPLPAKECLLESSRCQSLYEQHLRQRIKDKGFLKSELSRRRAYPYLDKAFSFYQKGDISAAISELDIYLAADAEHDLMRWYQVVMISMQDQPEKIIHAASEFIKRIELSGPALLIRANAYQMAGDQVAAEKDYSAALDTNLYGYAQPADVLTSLFDIAYSQNDYDKAERWLNRLVSVSGESIDLVIQRAILYEKAGKGVAAIRVLEGLLEVTDDPVIQRQAMNTLGGLYEQRSDFSKAFHYFAKSLTLEESTAIRLRAEEAAWKIGDYQSALVMLEPVIKNKVYDPVDEYDLRNRYCQLYEKIQKYKLALTCIKSLQENYPNHEPLLRYGAELAFKAGDEQLYLEELKQLYAETSSPEVSSSIAFFLERQEQYLEAEQWHAKSYRRSHNPSYALAYAESLLRNGKVQEAVDLLKQTLSKRSLNQQRREYIYATLAGCYLRENDYDNADEMWDMAYQISSKPVYILRRAVTNNLAEQYDDAYTLIAPHGVGLPTELPQEHHHEWFTIAGEIYYRQKEFEKSEDVFRQLAEVEPLAIKEPELALAYADSLLRNDKQAEAIAVFVEISKNAQSSPEQREYAFASLASIYVKEKNYAMADAMWDMAYLQSQDPVYLLRRIVTFDLSGDLESASQLLETRGAEPPDGLVEENQIDWYRIVGNIYFQAAAYDSSQQVFEQLVEHMPSNDHYRLLAESARANKDLIMADQAYENASRLGGEDPYLLKERTYMHLQAGDTATAEQLLKRSGKEDAGIQEELGYLALRQNKNAQASKYFRSALHSYEDISRADEDSSLPESRKENLNQLITTLEKQWSFSFYDGICLGSETCETSSEGLISPFAQGFGQVEIVYHPGRFAYNDGKQLQFYARLLWQNKQESLRVNSDSVQPALGLRYKPLAKQNLWFSAEYLAEGGDATQEHVLLRTAWSHTSGSDWQLPDTRQYKKYQLKNYSNLYVDAGKLFKNLDPVLLYSEGRLGKTAVLNQKHLLSGFGYLRGSFEYNDEDRRVIDAGLGLEWRFRHNSDRYRGYRNEWSLLFRVGREIENSLQDEDYRANLGLGVRF